jgi:cytochrome c553
MFMASKSAYGGGSVYIPVRPKDAGLRRYAVLLALVLSGSAVPKQCGAADTATTILSEPGLAKTEHVCSACHGTAGKSVSPTFPNLAGQQKEYFIRQLKNFRDHSRAEPHAMAYMWGMAASLDDKMIDALADWYSRLPPADGQGAEPAEIDAGRRIFAEGIPNRSVPACQACHGEKGEGADSVPRLAGQHGSYLSGQLDAFASRARENEVMHEIARNLNSQQMAELAAYLSSL